MEINRALTNARKTAQKGVITMRKYISKYSAFQAMHDRIAKQKKEDKAKKVKEEESYYSWLVTGNRQFFF